VFYQCYVRAFRDSDGDGFGDLAGLIEKLDYLQELGVGGIWLMPVMESSDNLHGYATSDYREIERDYGTLDDLGLLLREAHRRGIGVIIDFVINHSSSWHPFFVDSETGPLSPYRNWYIWEARKPGKWPVPTVSFSSWHQGSTGYYYAPFWGEMPEWNYRSMAVKNYMADNFKFWLNLGVDGYRLDAIHHLIENGPGGLLEQPESHLYFQYLRAIVDQYQNRFMVCEHSGWEYLGEHEFHSGFAFGFNRRMVESVRDQRPWILDPDIRNYILRAPQGSKYSIFLANHDFFAGRRPYDQLGGNVDKCKLAASLLFTLPGIPFIYYGEEIGMTSINEYQRDYSLRTPMQWHAGLNAGFTQGTPFRVLNENFATINVAVERADSSSIFNHYVRMTAIRNEHPALWSGGYQRVPSDDDAAFFAFLRSTDEETILVVLNFSGEERSVVLDFTGTDLEDHSRSVGRDLYDEQVGHHNLTAENSSNYIITGVSPFGIRIFNLD
jgi:glycosidase